MLIEDNSLLIDHIILDCVSLEGGKRKCPHCDTVQPPNKLGFIRHIAMEHEDVMENLAREFMDKAAKDKENDTHTEAEGCKEMPDTDKVDEKSQSDELETQINKVKDVATSEPSSDVEKTIMDCDPMIEEK